MPDIIPHYVVAVGATGLRKTLSQKQMVGILRSHMTGLKDAYLFAMALAAIAVLLAVLDAIGDARELKEEREKKNTDNENGQPVPIVRAL